MKEFQVSNPTSLLRQMYTRPNPMIAMRELRTASCSGSSTRNNLEESTLYMTQGKPE